MSVQKDDSVCLQSEFSGDVCPQSIYGFSPGDSELHWAAGGRGDGQTYDRLTSGDLSPAPWRTAQGEATVASLLLLHSNFGR